MGFAAETAPEAILPPSALKWNYTLLFTTVSSDVALSKCNCSMIVVTPFQFSECFVMPLKKTYHISIYIA